MIQSVSAEKGRNDANNSKCQMEKVDIYSGINKNMLLKYNFNF